MGGFWTRFRFWNGAGQTWLRRSVPPNLQRFLPFSSPPPKPVLSAFPIKREKPKSDVLQEAVPRTNLKKGNREHNTKGHL